MAGTCRPSRYSVTALAVTALLPTSLNCSSRSAAAARNCRPRSASARVAAGGRGGPTALPCCRSRSRCRPEQHRSVDQRAGLDSRERQRGGCGWRGRWSRRSWRSSTSRSPSGSSGAIADVEIVGALYREQLPGRRAADQEAEEIAVGVEAALGDRDQRAARAAARAARRPDASRPLLFGSALHAGRHRDRLRRARAGRPWRNRSARSD